MERNEKIHLNLGDPDLENFRKNIPAMKRKSKLFKENRKKAHEITEDELSIHFNL